MTAPLSQQQRDHYVRRVSEISTIFHIAPLVALCGIALVALVAYIAARQNWIEYWPVVFAANIPIVVTWNAYCRLKEDRGRASRALRSLPDAFVEAEYHRLKRTTLALFWAGVALTLTTIVTIVID